jgi:EmrB/QacA subfamily drug resistance transporter
MSVSVARRRTITAGLLLGMLLGALEATVVGTAMPTVIASLGGLNHYSWVFSAYLLTSTASVPIWGRLSDLYGRRRLYLIGVGIFMVGSALAGAAQSMGQLIVFRALQGLGAGALVPLALTIISELYTIAERPRVQALFSGMWGVSSIAGPLVGGYLTDTLSWRSIFYINIPFGLLTAIIIGTTYPGQSPTREVSVDWPGAVLLFTSITALLAGLSRVAGPMWIWLVVWLGLTMLFALVERRAREPILPLTLFRRRLVSASLAAVFLLGVGMFAALAFVPLLVQGVLSGTASQAGRALTPLFLGWVVMSILGARLTLLIGYRPTAWIGTIVMALSFTALARVHAGEPLWYLPAASLGLGAGMGFAMLALLLALQHAVPKSELGLATSLNQFARSIGAAVGVAAMGTLLSWMLGPGVDLQTAGGGGLVLDAATGERLAAALRAVFAACAGISALAAVPLAALPPVTFDSPHRATAGEELIAAEMATLDPGDEPRVVDS